MPEPITPDQLQPISEECVRVAKRNALRIAAERYEDAPRAYVDHLSDLLVDCLTFDVDALQLPTLSEWSEERGWDYGAELDLERSRGL